MPDKPDGDGKTKAPVPIVGPYADAARRESGGQDVEGLENIDDGSGGFQGVADPDERYDWTEWDDSDLTPLPAPFVDDGDGWDDGDVWDDGDPFEPPAVAGDTSDIEAADAKGQFSEKVAETKVAEAVNHVLNWTLGVDARQAAKERASKKRRGEVPYDSDTFFEKYKDAEVEQPGWFKRQAVSTWRTFTTLPERIPYYYVTTPLDGETDRMRGFVPKYDVVEDGKVSQKGLATRVLESLDSSVPTVEDLDAEGVVQDVIQKMYNDIGLNPMLGTGVPKGVTLNEAIIQGQIAASLKEKVFEVFPVLGAAIDEPEATPADLPDRSGGAIKRALKWTGRGVNTAVNTAVDLLPKSKWTVGEQRRRNREKFEGAVNAAIRDVVADAVAAGIERYQLEYSYANGENVIVENPNFETVVSIAVERAIENLYPVAKALYEDILVKEFTPGRVLSPEEIADPEISEKLLAEAKVLPGKYAKGIIADLERAVSSRYWAKRFAVFIDTTGLDAAADSVGGGVVTTLISTAFNVAQILRLQRSVRVGFGEFLSDHIMHLFAQTLDLASSVPFIAGIISSAVDSNQLAVNRIFAGVPDRLRREGVKKGFDLEDVEGRINVHREAEIDLVVESLKAKTVQVKLPNSVSRVAKNIPVVGNFLKDGAIGVGDAGPVSRWKFFANIFYRGDYKPDAVYYGLDIEEVDSVLGMDEKARALRQRDIQRRT